MSDATENAGGARKRKPRLPRPLTIAQIRFCELVAEHGCATRAFVDAGFEASTRAVARTLAWRLLRDERVRALIHELRADAATAAKASVVTVAAAMAKIAMADRRRLFDAAGRLLPPHEWPDDVAAAVESVKLTDGTPTEVRTGKRLEALRLLAAWLRMLGTEAANEKVAPAPLVVGGEANPDLL
jgi:phage terminase small subunit